MRYRRPWTVARCCLIAALAAPLCCRISRTPRVAPHVPPGLPKGGHPTAATTQGHNATRYLTTGSHYLRAPDAVPHQRRGRGGLPRPGGDARAARLAAVRPDGGPALHVLPAGALDKSHCGATARTPLNIKLTLFRRQSFVNGTVPDWLAWFLRVLSAEPDGWMSRPVPGHV